MELFHNTQKTKLDLCPKKHFNFLCPTINLVDLNITKLSKSEEIIFPGYVEPKAFVCLIFIWTLYNELLSQIFYCKYCLFAFFIERSQIMFVYFKIHFHVTKFCNQPDECIVI